MLQKTTQLSITQGYTCYSKTHSSYYAAKIQENILSVQYYVIIWRERCDYTLEESCSPLTESMTLRAGCILGPWGPVAAPTRSRLPEEVPTSGILSRFAGLAARKELAVVWLVV